jgi:putative copper resistance protein D
MSWFGAEIDGPMIATRTVHFTASAVTAGALICRDLVAEPALRVEPHANALVERQLRLLAWIGIAVAVVSGVTWVLLLTMSLSGEGLGEAVISGALRDVLDLTQFGWVSQMRLGLATVLSICLAFDRSELWRLLALGAAAALVASIAWTGHAASTPSALGYLHLASDALHLVAAAAWIGGLIPLVLLLRTVGYHRGWSSLKLDAVRRFSILAIISVATLTLSGFVNSWILVGSFRALVMTDYGQLLMLKLVVFTIMLVFAAINRLVLTPQLVSPSDEARQGALDALSRNTLIEIALGLSIFAVVGVLGTQHPAAHLLK